MKKRPLLPNGSTIQSATPVKDDEGVSIVRVQLISGEIVKFDKTDYDELAALGITSCPWFILGQYVAVCVNSKVTLLQRVIMGAAENERVWFRSKDRRNLRQSNLQIKRERTPRYWLANERIRTQVDQTIMNQLFEEPSVTRRSCT